MGKREAAPRYQRNIGTIGVEGQKKLLSSKVAVAGAGGLGGAVIELLARVGVGYIRVIDGDVFTEQNLNRQLLCTEGNLGLKKVEAALARSSEVNSSIKVEIVDRMLDSENAARILNGVDIVVDALDTFSARLAVEQAAKKLRIPMIHAAIAGLAGYVTIIMPEDAGLRQIYGGSPGIDQGVEVELGNLTPTPVFTAALQVQEVIKLITGIGIPLHRTMLCFDMETNLFDLVKMSE